MFEISGDSPSDPIARRPTEEQMEWACRVAAAQERLVRDRDLDALAYYYHGAPGTEEERLQAGFIVGHSLLTSRGVPCAGEGDLKTAMAMKIGDVLGVGGSFTEIVVVDYADETILLGHDGPFHMAIAEGRPILRGMGLYHGKQGTGVSVEAKVRTGPITTLNVTQTGDGRLKLISSEGDVHRRADDAHRQHPDAGAVPRAPRRLHGAVVRRGADPPLRDVGRSQRRRLRQGRRPDGPRARRAVAAPAPDEPAPARSATLAACASRSPAEPASSAPAWRGRCSTPTGSRSPVRHPPR